MFVEDLECMPNLAILLSCSRASGLSGERSPFEGSCCGSSYNNVSSDTPSQEEQISKFRVVLLGESGVGKTALMSQFMTSEYIHTYDASLDDEFGEKSVSVSMEDEESEMWFIDHPACEMSVSVASCPALQACRKDPVDTVFIQH
ncbi:Ras-related protein Rab-25 [Frankliniella fusca]|uniref:Ras-related protein Rab-25 n=1 Tax=Frankliniella fusca TaxID=407009 RepID=A0AAE1I1F8_9NEOP|nr:Ras-related protein Rab-25 [Frankliniella fusca]